jgi:hypothetical protein
MDIKLLMTLFLMQETSDKSVGVALASVKHTNVDKACICILVILLTFDTTYVYGNKCIVLQKKYIYWLYITDH